MKSHFCRISLSILLASLGVSDWASAEPIIASLDRFQDRNRVNDLYAGRLLVEELNCVACHDAGGRRVSPRTAPILGNVSGRVKADYLKRFIADPHGTKSGTTMPNLFAGKSAAQRDQEVEALVHFLYSIGPGQPRQGYASFGARRRGKQLFHEVGCAACHDPEGKQLIGSVPHGDLGDKYTLASLAVFLQDPHQIRPAGRMPSLNLSADEASDIASYLLPHVPEKSGIEFEHYEVRLDRLPDFEKLTPHSIGTTPEINIQTQSQLSDNFALRFKGELEIANPGSYRFFVGSDDGSRLWIDDRLVVDNDGLHGMQWKNASVELAAGRHAVAIDFFERDGGEELEILFSGPGIERQQLDRAMVAAAPEEPLEDLAFPTDSELAIRGQQLFNSLGCAACHETGQGLKSIPAPPLATLDTEKGCLADAPITGVDYSLSEKQKAALRSVAGDSLRGMTPKQVVQHSMLQFNCVACHERDGIGGVDTARAEYFSTTQQEMGVEGSIPPHLDGVGGKLTREWLEKILAEGAKDRPYMKTRMPKFGADKVQFLAAHLETLDQIDPLPKIEIDTKLAKQAGHKMVGAQGFACIKCHTFGRYKATGVQSIDLTIMSKRLREDWFRAYVRNPQAYRRGTRMPSAWPPAGPSLLPELLDADSERQIAAVWRYLQDGIRAKTPLGLSTSSHELIPMDEAIIYRNFIQGAGPRAIAVGYPEGLHIAFDANDLRLALIWQGQFMDASRHWNGRGQGFQPPAGDKLQSLVPGVSIATLTTATAAWPTLSARALGHQFRGYQLSSDGRPTFFYQIDNLQVSDFVNPIETQANVSLGRTLTIAGRPEQNTFLRLASGSIQVDAEGFDVGNGLRIRIADAGELNVGIRKSNGAEELLVPLTDKQRELTIQVEYIW